MSASVLVIDMQAITEDCRVCGSLSFKKGIPMYEDMVLHNDYAGEWFGQPACDQCFALQSLLTEPMSLDEFKKIRGIKAAEAAGGGE